MRLSVLASWAAWVRGGGRLMNTVSNHPYVALAVVVVLAGLAVYLARRRD